MTLVLLLLSAVVLAVVVLAWVVITRASAGHGLEDELVAGADEEPWAPTAEHQERIAA